VSLSASNDSLDDSERQADAMIRSASCCTRS
jgi:hypothetical protein